MNMSMIMLIITLTIMNYQNVYYGDHDDIDDDNASTSSRSIGLEQFENCPVFDLTQLFQLVKYILMREHSVKPRYSNKENL